MLRTLIVSALLTKAGYSFASDFSVEGNGQLQNTELGGTVVLQVDTRTNKMQMVRSSDIVRSAQQAQSLTRRMNGQFAPVPAGKILVGPLSDEFMSDDVGTDKGDKWYFYYPYGYNYYPYYSYGSYGYYYPYYTYNYGYYNYYY